MRRTYELALVLDPHLADEDVVSIVEEYKAMITASGAEITKEESWGKRKLAYPINKVNEGRYIFLFIVAEKGIPPFREIETRLNQRDEVLRYLTLRTDRELERAVRKGKKPVPAAEAVGITPPPGSPLATGEV
jgi:small subunit ribosomal protein S6